MGNDTPLACLSEQNRPVFDFFYQLFAQVTNPPIDPIREAVVMSLGCWVGPETNVLANPSPRHCQRLWLDHPCLLPAEMAALPMTKDLKGWEMRTVDSTFPMAEGAAGMERHLVRVANEAVWAAKNGYQIIHKLRTKVAFIVESGEPYEVAHHALLLTFGCDAVFPYMAYEALRVLASEGKFGADWTTETGFAKYQKAEVAEMCFTGIASQLGGLGFEQIALRSLGVHDRGFSPDGGLTVKSLFASLPNEGKYHYRQGNDAEKHLNDPMVIAKLQEAARTNSRAAYASFAALHNNLVKASQYGRAALPLDAVEPASEIVKRFRTGAMSYGSISMEAHSTLAIALNRLGGFSNTGEGGEDPARYEPLPNGDSLKSAIKQVASGRFGVTMEYLSSGLELQIKMAQGAKPGEGGELPGKKVQGGIAKTRNSTPGVGLISPPPHHDIYSIEDLAQLIFDLKNANPDAGVSVKLVSEIGVGVVATGVAKCKADHILISGCDGGTGASKWTGIKHAGAPWEIGLAETHQTLVLNGLRGRVTLETDGQLRTGRDVVIAALLGAERFGFATAPLIAMGCIMMRKGVHGVHLMLLSMVFVVILHVYDFYPKHGYCGIGLTVSSFLPISDLISPLRKCHLNTCPVGIATQDPVLRKKFEGLPEHVVNYLLLVAEEVRVLMAKMGFRNMDELIGHAEVLRQDPSVRGPLQLEAVLAPAHQLPDAGKMGKVENRKLYTQEHFMDYFGKGLSGGALVVYPPRKATFEAAKNIIIGNTALYGATAGVAFVNGIAAERFAVRNSGVWAVVEGAGDHCCEYMTGVMRTAHICCQDFKAAVKSALERGEHSPIGSMREYLPSQEVINDPLVKQRIRKHPKARKSSTMGEGDGEPKSLDMEDMAIFQKTTKGNRPQKILCRKLRAIEDAKLVASSNRGFLEVDRGDLPKRGVAERVADFQEILAKKDEVAVQTQASRCMDCGTPFCHQSVTDKSGCPLGNLIPEWNDLVRKGAWYDAFKRLMSTNNFPEFTGRVCPAPCEGSRSVSI
eukprot:g10805.t1